MDIEMMSKVEYPSTRKDHERVRDSFVMTRGAGLIKICNVHGEKTQYLRC